MPTYTFKCPVCGLVKDVVCSISHYSSDEFYPPNCHATMVRFFTSPDPSRALDLLTSDAIYQDLKASDGTDISTRAKHRAYMKEHNLTTVDDFTETWKQAAQERARSLTGHDPSRTADLARAWESHHG